MGATRDVALSELNFRGISINPASEGSNTITVVASDSGLLFINKWATYHTTYNLPAVAEGAGKMFWFYQGQATNNLIITAPAAIMITANAVNTTVTSDNAYGSCGIVFGDGTNYYFIEIDGTWANS